MYVSVPISAPTVAVGINPSRSCILLKASVRTTMPNVAVCIHASAERGSYALTTATCTSSGVGCVHGPCASHAHHHEAILERPKAKDSLEVERLASQQRGEGCV